MWSKQATEWIASKKARSVAQWLDDEATKLAWNPHPPGMKRIADPALQWSEGLTYRIRAGNYRIIYADVSFKGYLVIVRVMSRDEVYD